MGNLGFKIDRASSKVRRKFAVFAFFYFVFEDNFLSTSPGGLYSEERFNGGFISLRAVGDLQLEGLIHGGAYFRNFAVFWNAMKEGLKFLMLCVFNTDLFFFSHTAPLSSTPRLIYKEIFSCLRDLSETSEKVS